MTTKLSKPELVKQIHAYYNLSTDQERVNGMNWYAKAYSDCAGLAHTYGLPVNTVVGIVAALSPRNKWERNMVDAEQVILHGEQATVCTFHANKTKAVRMINGEEPLDVLAGNKVRAFYNDILYHNTTPMVCVDSHAYAVATGYGERIQVKVIPDDDYALVSDAYTGLSQALCIRPCQLQAITWLTYRRIHKIR